MTNIPHGSINLLQSGPAVRSFTEITESHSNQSADTFAHLTLIQSVTNSTGDGNLPSTVVGKDLSALFSYILSCEKNGISISLIESQKGGINGEITQLPPTRARTDVYQAVRVATKATFLRKLPQVAQANRTFHGRLRIPQVYTASITWLERIRFSRRITGGWIRAEWNVDTIALQMSFQK